jgi:hypothetical protein
MSQSIRSISSSSAPAIAGRVGRLGARRARLGGGSRHGRPRGIPQHRALGRALLGDLRQPGHPGAHAGEPRFPVRAARRFRAHPVVLAAPDPLLRREGPARSLERNASSTRTSRRERSSSGGDRRDLAGSHLQAGLRERGGARPRLRRHRRGMRCTRDSCAHPRACGRIELGARCARARWTAGAWNVRPRTRRSHAPVVVNLRRRRGATSSACLAGVRPIGLRPPSSARRSRIEGPGARRSLRGPPRSDIERGVLLQARRGSAAAVSADETPSAACDVQPEELDVAIAVDRFERATSLRVDG